MPANFGALNPLRSNSRTSSICRRTGNLNENSAARFPLQNQL
jgi:hypothetical protein